MVNLELLERLVNSGQFPSLVCKDDIANIQKIVDANPSFFGKPWHERGSKRIDEGVYFEISESEEKMYCFTKKIPIDITQYQMCDGTIYESPLFKYAAPVVGYKFRESDPIHPDEVLGVNGDIPLFPVTIELICDLAAKVTGNPDTDKLCDVLSLLDFSSDMEMVEVPEANAHLTNQTLEDPPARPYKVQESNDVVIWDHDICNITLNNHTKTFKISVSKQHDFGPEKLRQVVEYMMPNAATKIRKNTESVLNVLASESFVDDTVINNIEFEFTADGLSQQLTFQIGSYRSKLSSAGTSPHDNFARYSQKCADHNNSIANILERSTRYSWCPEQWNIELSSWEDSNFAENIHGVLTITPTSTGTICKESFGYSGPKNGRQPTNS